MFFFSAIILWEKLIVGKYFDTGSRKDKMANRLKKIAIISIGYVDFPVGYVGVR